MSHGINNKQAVCVTESSDEFPVTAAEGLFHDMFVYLSGLRRVEDTKNETDTFWKGFNRHSTFIDNRNGR